MSIPVRVPAVAFAVIATANLALVAPVRAEAPSANENDAAAEVERRATEDELFGGADTPVTVGAGDRDEDAIFGGAGERDEDEMFGGSPPETQVTPSSPSTIGGEAGNLEATDPYAIARDAAAAFDKLQIGGRALIQGAYIHYEDSPREWQQEALRVPSLLDVYLDSRPSDRVRFYARGRLTLSFDLPSTQANLGVGSSLFGGATPGAADTTTNAVQNPSAQIDQLWMNFDIAKAVFLTIGKQRIRWGAGRFWNPTDFLNQQRLNPFAVFDLRLGVPLVKVHVPVESLGWNFYAIADLQAPVNALLPESGRVLNPSTGSFTSLGVPGQLRPDLVGGALRAEVLLGLAETALSVYAKPVEFLDPDRPGEIVRDTSVKLGADVSFPVWLLDARLEAAFVNDPSVRYFVDAPFEGSLFADTPTRRDRSGYFIPQLVANLEYQHPYSEEDSLFVSVEYFFNDAGYTNESLYPFLQFRNGISSLYLGRHYLNFALTLPAPGPLNDTTIITQALTNLSDGSWLARLVVNQTVLTRLSISAFFEYHFGSPGEFRQRIEIPADPVLLPDGFILPATQFSAFLALTLNI